MAVTLHPSPALGGPNAIHIGAGHTGTNQHGVDLEAAFDSIADTWWGLAKTMGTDETAVRSHTPACVTNVSDFGLMLAWSHMVAEWAQSDDPIDIVCEDPWLFRHLSTLDGVRAQRPTSLLMATVKRRIRGLIGRTVAAVRVARSAIALRSQRAHHRPGDSVLLAYGHPRSTADGQDAYFGSLMIDIPPLKRALHTDCRTDAAQALAKDGRSASLHAWGSLWFTLTMPFKTWRPAATHLSGPYGWLIKRAREHENSGGGPAMNAWQCHCQARWLDAVRPKVVAWPWENHAWERDFVRQARKRGVKTVGYQHSVVGPQMLNYAGHSNPDGVASLPDTVLTSGPATRRQLALWAIPEERLNVGGALRFTAIPEVRLDAEAPVFLALPFDGETARQMVDAACQVAAETGRRFLVKDHPMTPYHFADTPGVERTDRPLGDHDAVSAVVFAATTVGLEALLAGLPTLRFRPQGKIAIDILPYGVQVSTCEGSNLGAALDRVSAPQALDPDDIFAPVDHDLWRTLLNGDEA